MKEKEIGCLSSPGQTKRRGKNDEAEAERAAEVEFIRGRGLVPSHNPLIQKSKATPHSFHP